MAVVGLGLDLVDVGRFAAVLSRRPAIRDRLFTGSEVEYARALADEAPALAGRFAAKEAAMKALGVGLGAFGWADVAVERAESGAPGLVVTGRAAELASARGVGAWHLSISHTATTACAVVVAES